MSADELKGGMTNLRDKNGAVQRANFPSHWFAHAVREWIAAATAKLEPASEGAKVGQGGLCPNCERLVPSPSSHWATLDAAGGEGFYCKPAQPEPAAPVGEMPVEIRKAIWTLHQMKLPECDRAADDLAAFWLTQDAPITRAEVNEAAAFNYKEGWKAGEEHGLTHAAPQVAMTEAVPAYVIKALEAATGKHCHIPLSAAWQQDVRDWLAVRAQAAGVKP